MLTYFVCNRCCHFFYVSCVISFRYIIQLTPYPYLCLSNIYKGISSTVYITNVNNSLISSILSPFTCFRGVCPNHAFMMMCPFDIHIDSRIHLCPDIQCLASWLTLLLLYPVPFSSFLINFMSVSLSGTVLISHAIMNNLFVVFCFLLISRRLMTVECHSCLRIY